MGRTSASRREAQWKGEAQDGLQQLGGAPDQGGGHHTVRPQPRSGVDAPGPSFLEWMHHRQGSAADSPEADHRGSQQQQHEPSPGPGSPLTPLDSLQALPPQIEHTSVSFKELDLAGSSNSNEDKASPLSP